MWRGGGWKARRLARGYKDGVGGYEEIHSNEEGRDERNRSLQGGIGEELKLGMARVE